MTPAGIRVPRNWTAALTRSGASAANGRARKAQVTAAARTAATAWTVSDTARPPGGQEMAGEEPCGEQGEGGQEHLSREEQPGGYGAEQGECGGGQVVAQVLEGVEGEDGEQGGQGEVQAGDAVRDEGEPSRAPAVALPAQYRCMRSCSHRMRRLHPQLSVPFTVLPEPVLAC